MKCKTFCFKQMAGQLSDFNRIFRYEILLLLKVLNYLLRLYYRVLVDFMLLLE